MNRVFCFSDEPTSGVDPLARRSFWTMINRLADAGTAILVTTHYLEEAEQCNRLGFMVAGELVTEGSPTGIKSAQSGHLLEFIVDKPQRAMDLLKNDNERWRVSLFGERLHIITEDDAATGEQKYRRELESKDVHVISVREGRFLARRRFHQYGRESPPRRQSGGGRVIGGPGGFACRVVFKGVIL